MCVCVCVCFLSHWLVCFFFSLSFADCLELDCACVKIISPSSGASSIATSAADQSETDLSACPIRHRASALKALDGSIERILVFFFDSSSSYYYYYYYFFSLKKR